MTCYIVPASTAVIHYLMMKKSPSWKNDKHHKWLNILLIGASIFGVVDHWWNNELFLFGDQWLTDLMLGFTITLSIILFWGTMILIDKRNKVKSKESLKSLN